MRFHFHVYDGKSSLDRDGIELPDWETARIEAIRFAGEILKDDAPHVALSEDWRIEVTDEAGLILFQMLFVMTATPGLLQS